MSISCQRSKHLHAQTMCARLVAKILQFLAEIQLFVVLDIFFLDILSRVSPTVAVTPSDGSFRQMDVLSIILSTSTSLFRSTVVIKHC